MTRTAKFINNIQKEKIRHKTAEKGFISDNFKMIHYSMKNSLKLIEIYNSSFGKYNKLLLAKIEAENKILKNYIINENILKE